MFIYMSKWQVWTSWSFFTIGNPLATNTTIVSLLEIKNQKNHFGMACVDLLFAVLALWSLQVVLKLMSVYQRECSEIHL